MKLEKFIELNNKIIQRNDRGFYHLEYDKEAIKEYNKYVIKKQLQFDSYQEKFNFLVNNGYYVNFFEMYTIKDIVKLIEYAYSFKFKFSSFMAISKFYESYALKTPNNEYFLENYEDRIVCVSLFLAKGDIEQAHDLVKEMILQNYQPATPTFLNAGIKNSGEMISCFLLEIDDSLNSINYNLTTAMQLSKIGGGVALNLSKLRALGETVKNFEGVGKGIIPILKLFEDAFSYVDQLGKRPGAGAAYLSIFHADVIDFLDTKKINADEKSRIQNLSLGLLIPDKFMELAKNNEDMALFYPYNIYSEYGEHLDEMDLSQRYDELINNKNVKKKYFSARKLLQLISITQFESGYPYMIFIDNANKQNPLKNIGRIKMSNLCTEIFQIQTTSKIKDYGEENEIGYDINCNLGSLNVVNVMENKDIKQSVKIAMKALSAVSNMSNLKNAPGIKKANDDFHSVGLGVMNLHGFFTKNKIMYEAEEAKEFADIFFMMVNYYSILNSMEMARDKNKKFKYFEKSEYATGEYFKNYIHDKYETKSEKIKNIFKEIYIPTCEDWIKLKTLVQKHGLYNSYRLAIAPTQSISYIQNATASVQPVVSQIETRMYGNSTTNYPMPYLREDNHLFYKSAYNIDQFKLIDLVSVIQKHVDQGISTVIFVTSQNTTNDLVKYYYYAWKNNLKSIYYIRTKNLTIEECETCSV